MMWIIDVTAGHKATRVVKEPVGSLWETSVGWGASCNAVALSTVINWAVHIGKGDIHRHPQVCSQLLIVGAGLGICGLLLNTVGQFSDADEDRAFLRH